MQQPKTTESSPRVIAPPSRPSFPEAAGERLRQHIKAKGLALLVEVEVTRDVSTGTGARVSTEFHQLNNVQNQTTTAPKIPARPEDTKPVNKGPQQPQPAPQQTQSALSALAPKFSFF